MYQPWILDTDSLFAGAAFSFKNKGTLAFTLNYMGYGDERVTTLSDPEGENGEFYCK